MQISVNLKHLKKLKKLNLTLEEYLVLQILYVEPDLEINDFSTQDIITELEDKNYLRLIDCVPVLDAKAVELFENNTAQYTKEILDHMNELKVKLKISKRPFQIRTHGKNITARLSEGNELEEIKEMVTYKYNEWKGTEWQKYLTPATLFAKANFYKYMEQAEQNNNRSNQSIHELV